MTVVSGRKLFEVTSARYAYFGGYSGELLLLNKAVITIFFFWV